MSAVAFPFLRPAPSTVAASPWMMRLDGRGYLTLGGHLDHWDYASDLHLHRRLSLDLPSIAEQVGIAAADLHLRAVVTLGTAGGRLDGTRHIIWAQDVGADSTGHDIALSIQSRDLSRRLSLTTELILRAEPASSGPLSPKRAGMRLWSERNVVELEHGEPRFPIEVISFRKLLPHRPNSALWYLDWSPQDFSRDFTSAARLYINGDNSAFVQRVSEGDELLLRLIMSSIMVQMTRAALNAECFSLDMLENAPGSLGGVIGGWIRQSFPNQALAAVQMLALLDPAAFDGILGALASPAEGDDGNG
ncbi:hypothetical protein [Azospirillum brasilense]|uniref:Uncharacterized protein n=1 Tax=Azospirillum brasilense TaxID=192 RepID=A0A6L3ASW5_AZOBR|nr:hypothetical protein [Azospirillum brasilense]KAA0678182.1 hypothetical protein DS837_28095 [Azospirillum brasilense]